MLLEKFKINTLGFFLAIGYWLLAINSIAQASVPSPGKEQSEPVLLIGATAHIGNGKVIENAAISFEKGKITKVVSAEQITDKSGMKVIDVSGKHIYPGLILPVSTLGLVEIGAVRPTRDFREVGDFKPHVRSLIAYNTDSKVIPTVRSNGILLAQIVPQGGTIPGTSSIVEFDAWNWEDAAYKADDAVLLNWPAVTVNKGWWGEPQDDEQNDQYTQQVNKIVAYFEEAQAYSQTSHKEKNLRFEAMKGLFDKSKKLNIQANQSRAISDAVNTMSRFDIDVVITGGRDSWMVTDILKQKEVPVIYIQPHNLPKLKEDDIDLPYKTPALLQKAGVKYCIGMSGSWDQRNLPFNAGTAAAYGLSKEEALSAITLNTAEILGIDKTVGSLEVGKDATIIISKGDVLDMRTSIIEQAFVRGRVVDLDDKQKALYRKFSEKYASEGN